MRRNHSYISIVGDKRWFISTRYIVPISLSLAMSPLDYDTKRRIGGERQVAVAQY